MDRASGAKELVSEDFHPGPDDDGVRAIHPFA